MYRWHFILTVFWWLTIPALAADSPEGERVFQAAAKSFEDKIYERAEKEFAEFSLKYPQSPRVPEAILLQAQCRFERKNFSDVVSLLTSRQVTAGALADQYQFWIAEAQFHDQKFPAASEAYAELLRNHPESPLRLRASYGEAFSQRKLGNLARAVELLKDPAGAFQRAAQKSTNEVDVVRGYLLLGDALFAQRNYRGVEEALSQLTNRKLSPELDWQREYLLANSQLADGRSDDALKRVPSLVALAMAATNSVLHANSLMFRAAILENGKPDPAIQTYEEITQIKDVSIGQSRQAVLKIVDLMLAQNRLTNAIQRLKSFVVQNAQDPASDMLRLTLGELLLKHYYSLTEKAPKRELATNLTAMIDLLQQAKTNFDSVIALQSTNKQIIGKAQLNRGWCGWEESRFPNSAGKLLESQQAFQAAVSSLPVSEDQAIARFKWADCQFERKDFTNAIVNYRLVIDNYESIPQVRTNLFGQALDHILRSYIEVNDFAGAKDAMEKNLKWFPKNLLSHQGVLTYSNALLDRGKAVEARAALIDFQKSFSDSPALPEIQLAVASSYVHETNWVSAIAELESWMVRHTNHASIPQVAYDLPWAYYQQGNETNALRLFTNYVARFATNPLAALAQYWTADYYYRQGAFDLAQVNYQHKVLLQNTNLPSPDLHYQSRLMTGKAAFLGQSYEQARNTMNELIGELSRIDTTNSPSSLLPEALLVLGDILLTEAKGSSTNAALRFENAIIPFNRVCFLAPTNRLEALARGKIANCFFQLQRYADATNEYQKVLAPPLASLADVTIRSQAEVGLGEVLEALAAQPSASPQQRQQWLESALGHYLNVFYEKNLAAGKNEEADPFWVKKAGLQAGNLADRLRNPSQAKQIYVRLITQLPSLRTTLEKKIELLNQVELR